MPTFKPFIVRSLLILCIAGLPCVPIGCGSGNPNEAEYNAHTPPGKPPDNPEESFGQRRARTLKLSKKVADSKAKLEAAEAAKAKSQ